MILAAAAAVFAACTTVTPAASPTDSPAPASPTTAPTVTPIVPATPTAGPTATAAPTATATATATVAATASPGPSDGTAAAQCGSDWFTSPGECGGEIGDQFLFQCPPGGRATAIYGTDTYTDDSSACVAAVHAGLIGFEAGGTVTIELTPGLDAYVGSSRNGVDSSNWASWPVSFVFTGGANDPLAALIAQIPAALQGDCGEVTSFDEGVIVSVQCINIPGIEGYAVYTQFDTLDNVNAAYQSNVDYFGVGSDGADCRVGPSEGGYTVADSPAGRVMCNNYSGIDPNGLILFWTSESLLIEGTLALYGVTFQDMYDIWALAGPIP